MRPSFHPRLINGPFDDPGLFIPFLFENRAVIFDLGDITTLSNRDILKISHAFITHTHMDHFVGFDRLLRLFLGRGKDLYLFGPEGMLKNVEGKLAGYEWNLVKNYTDRFVLHVAEVHSKQLIIRQYPCRNRFIPNPETLEQSFAGTLYEEPAFTVRAVILDHGIPCLGFSIKEQFHINIKKEAVSKLGLGIGPWLREFKQALFGGKDPNSDFIVRFGQPKSTEQCFVLGELADQIAFITPGQKITYISDVGYSETNVKKIVEFAKDTEHLFVEAAFLDKDKDIARKKYHLTAWQAGCIAGRVQAKQFTIFHFSPRYMGMENLLIEEAHQAFARTDRGPGGP
ncbi:ribonuclease Z [Thermodesulfobacteriota bacterium]